MEKLAAVKHIAFFEGLPEANCARLADIAVVKKFDKGETLFLADTPADGFYSTVSGRVKVFRSSPSGKEHILHVFGPGEAVGEVAMFQGSTFPAQCEALDDVEVLFFPRDGFRQILRDEPDMGMTIMALLAKRLRILVGKIDDLSLKETPSRVAAYLLLLRSSQDSDTLRLDLPKGQIALYLGTIQETLSRIFKKLSEDGIIQINGRDITILDQDALSDLAEQGR